MQYVYMLRAGESHYKVGVASNIKKRIYGIQTSNAHRIEVVTAIISREATRTEKLIHEHLKDMRSNGGTEWFTLTPTQAVDLAIHINTFADSSLRLELNDKLALADILQENRTWKRTLEKKLDLIVNNYQKQIKPRSPEADIEEAVPDEPTKPRYGGDEDLLIVAIEIIKEAGGASTSMLQRRMSIGYSRAARLIDKLEAQGVIGPMDGVKPRQILPIPFNQSLDPLQDVTHEGVGTA